jgi:hypothetical protein
MHKLLRLYFSTAGVDGGLVLGVDLGRRRLEAPVERVVEGAAEGFACALCEGLVSGRRGFDGWGWTYVYSGRGSL